MIEKHEYKGYWFIPDNYNNKVPGTLIVEPFQNAKLELIGCFESEVTELFDFPNRQVIHGNALSLENKPCEITLFDCICSGSINFSNDFPIMRYNCGYVIDGILVNKKEDEVFDEIQGDITYLSEWLPAKIIQQSIEYDKDNRFNKISISASEEKKWEKSVDIDDKITLSLFNICNYDGGKIEMKEKTLVKIRSKNKSNFRDLLFQLSLFHQFLSFAAFRPCNYKSLKLLNNENYQLLSNGQKIDRPIILYFCENDYINVENSFHSSRLYHLFNYLDIENSFPLIIKKWYDIKNDIAPIRQHLIESIKPIDVFHSTNFLIIVQALEGYHRRFVDEDDSINLKIRLTQLVNCFNNVLLITEISENDIVSAKDSRHFYSHFFRHQGEHLLDGIALYNLYKKLRRLLICCVLKLIGFDNENIDKLLKKNNRI